MDIELFRTFLAVRETRHFGKAAQVLNLTQAAVSIRIKQLETRLDAPLFIRFRNNLQLTETGERFVPYAEEILLSWEQAVQGIAQIKSGRKTLRFGAVNGFCSIILKDALSAIYDAVSDIALRVEAHDEETLVGRLRDKRIDLALLYEPSRYTDYRSVPVSSVELVHVSTVPGQSRPDILAENYIEVEWGAFLTIHLASLAETMPEPILRATQANYALQFLLEQGGSAYLPNRLVQEHLGRTLFPVVGSDIVHKPIYAVYHQGSVLGERIGRVVDIIRCHAQPLTINLDELVTGKVDELELTG